MRVTFFENQAAAAGAGATTVTSTALTRSLNLATAYSTRSPSSIAPSLKSDAWTKMSEAPPSSGLMKPCRFLRMYQRQTPVLRFCEMPWSFFSPSPELVDRAAAVMGEALASW